MHVTELVNHGAVALQAGESHQLRNREHDHDLAATFSALDFSAFLTSLRHVKCESIA